MESHSRGFINFLIVTMYWMEKTMAPHSSTLAWKIPWTEEPGRLQSVGSRTVGHTERLHFHFSLSCIGEGNDNPLQCSYLENPGDGGAWWAAVYGVWQSQTWLKRLSSSSRITETDHVHINFINNIYCLLTDSTCIKCTLYKLSWQFHAMGQLSSSFYIE